MPFHECVDNARPFVFARGTVNFELELVVEVLVNISVYIQAQETHVEAAVRFLFAAVAYRVLSHYVAAEPYGGLHILDKFGTGIFGVYA